MQAQDTPGSKTVPQQASLYVPHGERGPGRCWDRFVGKCLVMLGAGYIVFPKRGNYGHLSQGSPCPTSGEEAVGVP